MAEDAAVESLEALVTPPQSVEDVAEYLRQIGRLQRQLSVISHKLTDEIERLKAEAEKEAAVPGQMMNAMIERVVEYAQVHQFELVKRGTKTATLSSGELIWRSSSELVIENPKTIISRLRRLKWMGCIRVKYEPDKRALRKKGEKRLRQNLRGVYIQDKEILTVKPNESEGVSVSLEKPYKITFLVAAEK